MDDLATGGLLSPALVEAMDADPTSKDLAEYRFPRTREAYTHQVEAWQHLLAKEPRSVLISSGTGSGKTECFLVPILDELARAQEQGPPVGVRALFLYPLNALINSQRDRLRAWCAPFGGRVRFCLYTGDTPEAAPASERRAAPAEVLDRKTLRASPPPLLVTNTTMLEYMLVRRDDQPILEQSRGLLRWVVLDEAHTYLGSQAAETALLLRRVIHSFGVSPEEVRFVATSATIGTDDSDSRGRLQAFLSTLAGVPEEAVHVVVGHRRVPDLSPRYSTVNHSLPDLQALAALDPVERYEVLASNGGVRELRRTLLEAGPTPTRVLGHCLSAGAALPARSSLDVLRVIDLATSARDEGGAPFLRVRAHFFHRTHEGTWACINPTCEGRAGTALDSPSWPFGRLYFERRTHCAQCRSIVLDLVLCAECGADFLLAERVSSAGVHRIGACEPTSLSEADEYAELVGGDSDEGEGTPGQEEQHGGVVRLIAGAGTPRGNPVSISAGTGEVDGAEPRIELSEVVSETTTGHRIRCPRCGVAEKEQGERFRHARRGGAFFLRGLVPLMLEHTEPAERDRGKLPAGGRRLISFTDSRQGTARFALDTQLDAERNYIRSWTYHQVVARRIDGAATPERLAELDDELANLMALPDSQAKQRMVHHKQRELARLKAIDPGRLPWADALSILAGQPEIAKWMRAHWNDLPLASLSERDLASFFLVRELGRRPKNQNSLETLGFVKVEYPKLDDHASVPAPWAARALPSDEWRAFLKVCLDFHVRGYSAIEIDQRFIRWFGAPIRPHVLVGPDSDAETPLAIRWPTSSSRRGRLVQLLARALRESLDDGQGRADVDTCLRSAWDQLYPLLSHHQGGMVLRLDQQVEMQEVRDAWLCPVTRRVLDTTVAGFTPYLTPALTDAEASCISIQMPVLHLPFWRQRDGTTVPRTKIEKWLAEDPAVSHLRGNGVWTDISDRIAAVAAYYQVGEHSAQQSPARLRELERRFKEGRLNLLSCSTTMELGVDIGGLAAVAMNNAPPSPANYLQRAGRAGRRGETRAFSVTVCRSSPHEEQVFRNPTWPFRARTVVPDVGLRSERIVQRHVNALLLARFFQTEISDRELPKLQAGAFFETPEGHLRSSVCARFEEWLLSGASGDEWLCRGLEQLVRYSPFEGMEIRRLLSMSASEIGSAKDRWLGEVAPVREELAALANEKEKDPARRAVELRLQRLKEEYLLRELTVRNFLPGHGFPTNVVPFITTTVDDLERRRRRHGTESGPAFGLSQGYPSRDLALALRDYAPGNTVVLDGRVLESHGVTLNWHIPAGNAQVREIQALRWAWRCRQCGNAGVASSRPTGCPSQTCHGSDAFLDRRHFLQPAGFSVDLFYHASNDLTRNTYLPVEEPWLATGGEAWQSLARPDLGRFRYAPRGTIFAYSRGHGHGYAVCLKCGRAASESGAAGPLPDPLIGHRPLRGGKETNPAGRCRGTEEPWSIQRNLWFGVAKETDVFELQLFEGASGQAVYEQQAVTAIAVALRQALAERLGIEDREIGWATRPAREDGQSFRSIVLHDASAGGAGYVAQASKYLPELLRRARDILLCPRQCDGSCHACLLTYDTRNAAKELNRHKGLRVLSSAFLDGLDLPEADRCFGAETHLELESLEMALAREASRASTAVIRLFAGGDPTSWDLDEWLALKRLDRWRRDGVAVEVVITSGTLRALDPLRANRLAAWVETSLISVVEVQGDGVRVGDIGLMLAEVGGSRGGTRFAVLDAAALSPGERWGAGSGSTRVVRAPGGPVELGRIPDGRSVDMQYLQRAPTAGAAAVPILSECDGPVREFGRRFWKTVELGAAAWFQGLRGRGALEEIRYQDRYLHTPLAVRLLAEALKYLSSELVQAGEVPVHIVTSVLPHDARSGHLIWHEWQDSEDRQAVLCRLMAPVGSCRLEERRRTQAQHARELTLAWSNGRRDTLHLDQGFGFLSCRGEPRHGFRDDVPRQAASLAAADFWVEGRGKTYVYVLPDGR
jgi:ATP-dependent helicase YprA (DUF1998 family)